MKRKIILTLIILTVGSLSFILFLYLTGQPRYSQSVIHTTMYSRILNEEREVIIHLPRNYNRNNTYPVLYVLDGSSQDIHLANTFNILSAAGYSPETVIVGLPNTSGKGRQRDYTPPFMKMDADEKESSYGEGDKFLTFMEKELFPFMDNNYSCSDIRSIAGNSRGGLLVIYSLLFKPDMFQGRFCFSPALWRDDHLINKKVAEQLSSGMESATSFLYLSMGDKENVKMKNAFNELVKVLHRENHSSIVWYCDYTKNADHQNNAQVSAPVGIKKWSDYLKKPKNGLVKNTLVVK